MRKKDSGLFGLTLKSLKLQLETLLDDAGGADTISLLDELCQLNPQKREILVRVAAKVAKELAKTPDNQSNSDDFEEELFEGLVADFDRETRKEDLQLIESPGALIKHLREQVVVDISEIRKAAKTRDS